MKSYAAEDGFHAFNDNVPLSECPFSSQQSQKQWREGWLAAEKAADDQADVGWFKG